MVLYSYHHYPSISNNNNLLCNLRNRNVYDEIESNFNGEKKSSRIGQVKFVWIKTTGPGKKIPDKSTF